jgi:serine/threonine protein kinase/tetratricopeptide (TPR) repeat protein
MASYIVEISSKNNITLNTTFDGRYQILNKIGAGGMGDVYLVSDQLRGKNVVLKLLQPQVVTASSSEILRREFMTLASLSHPYLVRVYDFGKSSELGRYYYTMEYIDGVEFFDAVNHWPVEKMLPLFGQLFQTLDFIHSNGIFHGDIKSENVLVVTGSDGRKSIKLMDFGLAATYMEVGINRSGGTLSYYAPERFRGAPLSIKTDLYAAGVLIYWACAKRPPFDGSAEEIKQGHLEKIAPPLGSLCVDLPEGLEGFVARLLAKDPIERFDKSFKALDALMDVAKTPMDVGATIPSLIVHSFRKLRAEKIDRIIDDIQSYIGSHKSPDEKPPRFFLLNGNEGSGHDVIIDEIKNKLQVVDYQVCESFCSSDIRSAFEPLVNAFLQNEDIVKPIHKLYSEFQQKVGHGGAEGQKQNERCRYSFMEDVAQIVKRASEIKPFIVLLRSIEFADESTLELLYFLARAISKNVAFIASYTPDRQSHSINETIRSHTDSLESYLEWEIRPLDEAEIEKLSRLSFPDPAFPEGLATQLLRYTGGLPLIIADTFAELYRRGYLSRSQGTWVLSGNYDLSQIASGDVFDYYSKLFNALPEAEREIMEVLSVLGSAITVPHVFKILNKKPTSYVTAVQSLKSKGLVLFSNANDIDVLSIRSTGFRNAIYSLIDEKKCRQLHKNIIRLFEADDRFELSVEQKAFHYLHGGSRKEGLKYASQAFRRLKASHAHRPALAIASLAFVSCGEDQRRQKRLFQRRIAQVEEIVGNTKESLDGLVKVSEHYKKGVAKSAIYRAISSILQKIGEREKADEYLKLALAEILPKSKTERALVLREQSWMASVQGDCQQAIRLGREAFNQLDPSKPSRALASVLNNLGAAHYLGGNYEKVFEYYKKCADIRRKLADHAGLASTLNNIGAAYFVIGDVPNALDAWQECIDIREKIGDISGQALSHNNMGVTLMLNGEYIRAYNFLIKSKELQAQIGNIKGLVESLANLGELEYLREDYSAALEILQGALIYSKRIEAGGSTAEILYLMAKVYLSINSVEEASISINECLDLARSNDVKYRMGNYYVLKHREIYLRSSADDVDILKQVETIQASEKDPLLEIEMGLEKVFTALALKKVAEADAIINKTEPVIRKGTYNWHLVQLLLFKAHVLLLNRADQALIEEALKEAEKCATDMGLFLRLKDIYLMRGKLARLKGDIKTAFQYYRVAYQHLKAVLVTIKQNEYKKSMVTALENRELLAEIKYVQNQLTI